MLEVNSSSAKSSPDRLKLNLFKSIQAELAQLESHLTDEIPKLSGPLCDMLRFILNSKGKRLRPALALLSGKLTSPNKQLQPKHFKLASLTELIHSASLVHDDVIDDADSRRGQETSHLKWGGKIAVIIGDFLFAQASVKLGELENTRIVKIYADVLASLCIGEITQAQHRFDLNNLNWQNYLDKSYSKTASLFAAATQSAAILNEQNETVVNNLFEYGKNLGLAFQIIDDLIDFTSSAEELGKPAMGDLLQGILTAPVLYALEDNNCKDNLKELIVSRFHEDASSLEKAKDLIEASGAYDKTFKLAESYAAKALNAISDFPESNVKTDLKDLVDFVLQRNF